MFMTTQDAARLVEDPLLRLLDFFKTFCDLRSAEVLLDSFISPFVKIQKTRFQDSSEHVFSLQDSFRFL